MSQASCMVVVLVVLVVAPQRPEADPLFLANGSVRQAGRAGATTQVDLSKAELLRAQLVLLDGMNGMSQALDAARRNPAFVHDRPSLKALGAANDDFMKMSKAFHSMVKELTLATHGTRSPR